MAAPGFTWIAFGLLLASAAWQAAAAPTLVTWRRLLLAWCICWFPHAVIAIAVLVEGMDRRSVARYREWAAEPAGAVVLGLDAVLLFLHLAGTVAGFALTRRGLARRGAIADPEATS